MNIDNKMIMELAEQLGLPAQQGGSSLNEAKRAAEQYKNKSDDELVREILKLKETMKSDRASFEKQIATIRALGGMMQGEQKVRLQKILELLES